MSSQRGPSLGLRIHDELHNALKKLAAQDDRTVSNYVERLLHQHVTERGIKLKIPPHPANRPPVKT